MARRDAFVLNGSIIVDAAEKVGAPKSAALLLDLWNARIEVYWPLRL